MNNNNFALMRYLRDLGLDAHLFLFDNEIEHFMPESDTWELPRWSPFIHRLDFGNNPRHLLLRWRRLAAAFVGFEYVVGSGLTPALFHRAGKRLDLFYPYSPGVEYFDAVWMAGMFDTAGWAKRLFYRFVRKHQARGIQGARSCTNLDMGGKTEAALARLGRSFHRISVPMVYPGDEVALSALPEWLCQLIQDATAHRLSIVSHSRQHWIRPDGYSAEEWRVATKHNDYLLRGFAAYCQRVPTANPLLLLFDYGKDVEASKALIGELGIAPRVRWVPRCSRREILQLLRRADVCVAEFMEEGIWGGTAWEALACGRPVIQSVNFSGEGYRAFAGQDLPPILAARSTEDVTRHLLALHADEAGRMRVGDAGSRWFQENNGRKLAAKYVDIIRKDLGR